MSCGTCGIQASNTLQGDTGVPAGAPQSQRPRCPHCKAFTPHQQGGCKNPRCPSNRPRTATERRSANSSGGSPPMPDEYYTTDSGQIPHSGLCVRRVVRGTVVRANAALLRDAPSAILGCTYAVLFTDGSALAVTRDESTRTLHSTWAWTGRDYADVPHEDYNALPYEVRKHVGDKASFGFPEGADRTGDYGEWDCLLLPGSRSLVTGVFDDGGKTGTRYTVIFDYGRSFLTMSQSPTSPLGVSQVGENAVPSPDMGKRIRFSDLPPHIQGHVIDRWRDDNDSL